jgi:hypothetical protein
MLFVPTDRTHTGRCRIHINNGGVGPWCSFDFIVNRQLNLTGVEVSTPNDTDEETQTWFPHVKRGILYGIEDLNAHYERRLVQSDIQITHVYSHPVDTTAEGCERYGRLWVIGFGLSDSVQPFEVNGCD